MAREKEVVTVGTFNALRDELVVATRTYADANRIAEEIRNVNKEAYNLLKTQAEKSFLEVTTINRKIVLKLVKVITENTLSSDVVTNLVNAVSPLLDVELNGFE